MNVKKRNIVLLRMANPMPTMKGKETGDDEEHKDARHKDGVRNLTEDAIHVAPLLDIKRYIRMNCNSVFYLIDCCLHPSTLGIPKSFKLNAKNERFD